MINLGTVRPGATIRIPFSTFDKDDGSSITMTNFAAADILVYKDGSTTERASTAGFTATTDFDAKTGKHIAVINLADNTTAGFYAAGSEYLVAIDAVTVDAVTTGGWIARFDIGYEDAIINTTIATLASQTSFTITVGPAEASALLGCVALIHDVASAVQLGFGVISAYDVTTKTVTLAAGVTFTAAAGDNISIFPPVNTRWLGHVLQTGRDIGTSVLLSSGTGTGQLSLSSGLVTLAGVTHTGAVIPTVTTLTNLPTIPSNWLTAAGIAASALNGKGDWNVGKTGYSLTATTGLGNQTANITGNLSGSVGSVTGAVGSVTGAVGSVTGAVGSVTGNVGGNVVGSVGSVATGGITEASFATTAGSFHPLAIVDQGTAQSATGTTLVLRSAAAFANDELIGATILITGGTTGVGQSRVITDYVSSTDTATVDTWTTTPTGTITYKIFAGPPDPVTPPAVNVTHFGGTSGTFSAGRPEVNTTHAAGTAWGSGAITPGSIASDAITAAKVADDVSTEIRDKIVKRTTLRGTVSTGSSTTSITTSAMTPATTTADQVKNRVVIFDDDTTTAALRGQVAQISASTASATPTLTVSTMVATPASGDTFTIV
jgi:hypothetical protein